MAAAAIPLAASALAPEVAGAVVAPALGALTSATLPAWLAPALAGAGMGGIGSLLTGQNALRGAALGGIGGGISSQFGSLFNSGSSAAADAASEGAGDLSDSLTQGASEGMYPTSVGSAAASGSGISKFLPYAGLGLAATAFNGSPKQIGPTAQQHPSNSSPVSPLNRMQLSVDPNSYLSSGMNRSYFDNINPQVQFMAKGGPAGIGGGILANSSNKNPSAYPVMGRKRGVVRMYADGGSSSASSSNLVTGAGDGQSDSIPAQLSDGEFVVSAPVVSALGNGSNSAGAKKLSKMQKDVIHRHYKGNKPKKSLGIGGYVH